jgi:hypothetical protein
LEILFISQDGHKVKKTYDPKVGDIVSDSGVPCSVFRVIGINVTSLPKVGGKEVPLYNVPNNILLVALTDGRFVKAGEYGYDLPQFYKYYTLIRGGNNGFIKALLKWKKINNAGSAG